MLYVISNSDFSAAREKTGALVAGLKAKRPDASVVSLDHESASTQNLEGLTATQGLFAPKVIIRIDFTEALAEDIERFVADAKQCADSENIFVVSAGKLSAGNRRALAAHAQKFSAVDSKEKKEKDFPFALAQSLAESKARAFALYHTELQSGAAPEALHGVLFWKAKQMMARNGGAGARRIARGLVDIYHRAHRGDGDLALLLEKFILSL